MPVRLSRQVLTAAEAAGRGAQAAEYVLSVKDVALMFDKSPSNVVYWTVRGRWGWLLPCLSMPQGSRTVRAFRIYDVVKFAERTGLSCDLMVLPPAVRVVWMNTNQLHQ
jgi:hypothetical protein